MVEMNNRKMYNTTLDADLIRQIKILAAQLEKRQNDLSGPSEKVRNKS